MANEDIYSRYKYLYDSQNNSLKQKKDSAIQGYTNQQNDMNNQYTDLANSLKSKAEGIKSQYGNAQTNLLSKYNSLYTGLDQQNINTKGQNYTDRNNVDVGVNQNMARTQELMAKNGWTGGGENLQAQLNSNSDRMNGFGSADKSMNDTLTSTLNNRNSLQANQATEGNTLTSDEQNATNGINDQMTSNNRDQVSKIQQIMDLINSANVNYGADSQALKSNLDAQAMGEVYNAEQTAKAQAFQAQQAALSRAASKSSGGSAASAKQTATNNTNAINARFAEELDGGTAEQWLLDNRTELIQTLSITGYNNMLTTLAKNKEQWGNYNKAINNNQVPSGQTNLVNGQEISSTKDYRVGGGGRMLIN